RGFVPIHRDLDLRDIELEPRFEVGKRGMLFSLGQNSLDHLIELLRRHGGLDRDPDRFGASVLSERRRIRRKRADTREFGHRGTEGFNDFLLAALTLVPWSQPSEGDALRRCWSSGNDKVRLCLWHILKHRFQLAGVSIHETNGRPFGPHEKADNGAAVLDRGKLRLNGGENEIAASRDD